MPVGLPFRWRMRINLNRPLVVLLLAAAIVAGARTGHAQTTEGGTPTFPVLNSVEEELRTAQPTSVPPSQGPFGEQPLVPVQPQHSQPPPDAPSAWLIQPGIQVGETATDNASLSHTNRTADLITMINPQLTVTGDTERTKLDINYSPILQRNLVETGNNRLDQNLFGTGVFAAIPDAVFINGRGSAFEGSRGGGMGPINPTNFRFNDRTEILAYDGGPEWRFPLPIHDGATGDLNYTIGQTRFYSNTGPLSTGQVANPITNSTLQDLRLALSSGDRSGFLTGQLTTDGSRTRIDGGNGTNDSGVVLLETQLRLNPVFQLLGSVGYEDYRYSTASFANINDPTWYGGAKWAISDDTSVQLTYGQRQGIDSFAGNAHYAVTPLTTLTADYQETITTPQQQIISNLNQLQLNQAQVIINPQTGVPESIVANELALQNSIYRDKLFRAGLVTRNEPNVYTVSLRYEAFEPIQGTNPDSFIGADGTWQHAINLTDSFSLLAGYYRRQQFGQSTIEIQASLGRQITDTLNASIGYEFTYGTATDSSQSYFRNAITAFLRKTF